MFNRKNNLDDKGEALIQIEALLNKKKAYFSTNLHLPPSSWNKRKQIVVNHPLSDSLNAMLYEEKNKLEALEIAEWKRSGLMSISILRKLVRNNIQVGDFISFAKDVVQSSNRSKGTKGNLMTTIKRLVKFRSSIEFQDLNYTFIREFEKYLSNEHPNTAAKHLKNLRTLVNAAINEGYISANDYPYRKFRIKTVQARHEFLTPEELMCIEAAPRSHIIDAFLFCCYTGLRYSDFVNLKEENIQVIGGQRWLCFRTRKTDIVIKLPLHLLFDGKALDILDRYRVGDLVDIGCNADANAKLRKVIPPMGKKITWHAARHTCATLLIFYGVPVTTVQKLLGHTDVKTTMIYSEILSTTIMKDLSNSLKIGKNLKIRKK